MSEITAMHSAPFFFKVSRPCYVFREGVRHLLIKLSPASELQILSCPRFGPRRSHCGKIKLFLLSIDSVPKGNMGKKVGSRDLLSDPTHAREPQPVSSQKLFETRTLKRSSPPISSPPAQYLLLYFNFFLGRSWLVWPHFFFLQLVARGGRRA